MLIFTHEVVGETSDVVVKKEVPRLLGIGDTALTSAIHVHMHVT